MILLLLLYEMVKIQNRSREKYSKDSYFHMIFYKYIEDKILYRVRSMFLNYRTKKFYLGLFL